MRTNLVVRTEEWLSSVPTHRQLFAALGFEPVDYAHLAPLMKQEGGSKRKLSKRKDAEAAVDYYLEAGFPVPAVQYYLRGLANPRLAEVPLAEALATPLRLDEFGLAGPLVDTVKLSDISADHIATLSGPDVVAGVRAWATEYDPEVVKVLDANPELALAAIDVERVGVENPRKDLAKWSDFRDAYGFFFPELFTDVTDPADERFGGLDASLVRTVAADLGGHLRPRGRPADVVPADPRPRDPPRLRAQPEDVQEGPGRLPGHAARRRQRRPRRDHRRAAQPRPLRGHPGPRRRRGRAPAARRDGLTSVYVRTRDGRRIAYDREGAGGRPLVLVDGLGQMRATDTATRTLCGELAARRFDVVHHDRPGRGDSTGDPPFTLAGEVEALRALVDELGGRAALYGSSSGGAIALAAATWIPGVDHLVLWETPLATDGSADARAWHAGIVERTRSAGPEAVLRFAMDGMPPEWLDGMLAGPDRERYLRLAPTTAADAEALAWAADALHDGTLAREVTAPTTVLTGTSAWPLFVEAADALVDVLPHAERGEVPGAAHGWEPADLARVLAEVLL